MLVSSSANILPLTTSSTVESLEPMTDCLCLNACCTPAVYSKEYGAHNNRLIKHLEHPVAYNDNGPVPSQQKNPLVLLIELEYWWTTPAYFMLL